MNLQDIMVKIRDVVYPEYYKDQEKIDKLELELESCQIDLLSSESQLLDLLTDYNDLQDEHSECGLETSTEIDTFCKSNYKQISNIAYKEKRKSPLDNYYSVFLNELVQPSAFEVKNLFKRTNLTTDTYKASRTVGNIVARSVVWTDDKNLATSGDYYLYPSETIIDKKGDCVAYGEKIMTSTGVKFSQDIKEGELVQSYNFSARKWEFKEVKKVWDKGVLPVFKITFRNGTSIRLTADHKMLTRVNAEKEKIYYRETRVSDIKMNSYTGRKVPVATKIPRQVVDIEELSEEHCFIIGHFLAEGWNSGKVGTSGYDIPEFIIPKLELLGIPYSLGYNGNGVPVVNFLKSDFKEFLKAIKNNSFDCGIPAELKSLPDSKIQAILDGHFLGDGHYHTRNKNIGVTEMVYSTSCKQLAEDLSEIHLYLGKPVYIYKQDNHQGVGNKPIYRLYDYNRSHFRRDWGFPELSEVSIATIEPDGNERCFDYEVKDNHNFCFSNGVIVHNCEDHTFIAMSAHPEIGGAWGFYKGGGHAFNVFVYENKLYVLETTGSRAEIFEYEKQSDYVIHYIITRDNTYQLKGGVRFGDIAGWY